MRSRGAGSLAMLLLLMLGAMLMLLYLNRAMVFEQRAGAYQVRTAQATEAAEAGLAWALALLNHPGRIDSTCTPTTGTAAGSEHRFASRYLRVDSTGRLTAAVTARPGCAAADGPGWACHCPAASNPSLLANAGAETPAFALQFDTGPRAGTVRLAIDGCSHVGSPCGSTGRADATVRTQHVLAVLSAMPRTPYAAITARGAVTLQGAVEVVHTGAPAITVSSATNVSVENTVRLVAAPGQEPAGSVLASDTTWLDTTTGQPITTARWFQQHFTLARSEYRALPSVRVLSCTACTGGDVTAAYAEGARMLWVDGALSITSLDTFGAADDPLLLIVSGAFNVNAPVSIHGLVHAGSVAWAGGTGAQGQLHGALLSEGPAALSGRVLVRLDDAVLQRLRHATGAFAALPGSWRDVGD